MASRLQASALSAAGLSERRTASSSFSDAVLAASSAQADVAAKTTSAAKNVNEQVNSRVVCMIRVLCAEDEWRRMGDDERPYDQWDSNDECHGRCDYSRHGSRSASERRRLACSSLMNSCVLLSNLTVRPRWSAMFAAGQAMCALRAASAFPFGWLRVFTQSRKSRT